MKLLDGKVALITGAAQGIGAAIATVFAEQGAAVGVGDINQTQAADLAEKLTSEGGQATVIKLDVSDPLSVQAAIETLVAAYGRLDVLVNNAGILRAHYIVDFPLADWQAIFRVNMEGTFLCSQAAARQMLAQGEGGSIINVASASARKADSKHAAYSASKAAMITFTRILALELGEHGIRANALLPGATETPMLQHVFDSVPGIREDLIGKTVLKKLGSPRDQANAALFLASDLASHVTGEYLVVSGGEFMNA